MQSRSDFIQRLATPIGVVLINANLRRLFAEPAPRHHADDVTIVRFSDAGEREGKG